MNGISQRETILKRNLLALSSVDPELAARLSASPGRPDVQFIESRSAMTVPALVEGRRLTALHSRFDPLKEGLRCFQSAANAGCVVFLGLGAGYHILPFIDQPHICQLIVVDRDVGLARSVMERIDMRAILMDPRVKILLDPTPGLVESVLLSRYLPLLAGNLTTVSLQARVAQEKAFFQQILDSVEAAIGSVADDYTVQSRFGKKWFINTLANLPKAAEATQVLRPEHRVLITGAGPSLEDQMEQVLSLGRHAYLIASDTSLPTLLAHGVKPDLVISIDCQQVSYHHFLGGYPRSVPLVLDLASPPVLTTLTDRLVFFSSGHPFSQYLNSNWRGFPQIDTSGGNVSHAALSLARLLGAEEITLFGIDFSFPEGKSYARGTYIYRSFRSKESRLAPVESQNFSFLMQNRSIVKQRSGSSIRYTTKPMMSYKTRLEDAIRHAGVRVVQAQGQGVILDTAAVETPRGRRLPSVLSQGASRTSWRDFLEGYRAAVQRLAPPRDPLGQYWNSMSAEERTLWTTMLPAATAIREQGCPGSSNASQLLAFTRNWTENELQRRLRR